MRWFSGIAAVAALSATPALLWAQSTTTYTYDDLGRLKVVSYPSNAKTGYQYDAADNRTWTQTDLNGNLNPPPPPPPPNRPPNCGAVPIEITGVPAQVYTITVTGSINPPCNDPDGDTLTRTSPATAPTFTLTQGQSYTYSISVSDGHGGTGTGSYTYHRQ